MDALAAIVGKYVTVTPIRSDDEIDSFAKKLHFYTNGSNLKLGSQRIESYDADSLVWRYMPDGPFSTEEEFGSALKKVRALPGALPFLVSENTFNEPIGVACYLNILPAHLTIEVGWIFYSPLAQRSVANTETTLLLLREAFRMGYRRMVWKCDAENIRSRNAAERLGFVAEGVHESHYIIKGLNRDTAWFRILDREWPQIEEQLKERVEKSSPVVTP